MLKIDYHIHTQISPCASEDMELPKIIEAQEERGMTEIGVSDHCYGYEHKVRRVEAMRKEVSQYRGPLKVFLGLEAHMHQYRHPSVILEFAAQFDYVLMAPNHYHLRGVSRPDAITPEAFAIHEMYMFEAAVNCAFTDAVAHPFVFLPSTFGMTVDEMSEFSAKVMRCVDDKRLAYALDLAAQRDVGIELSPRFLSLRQSHLIDFYRLCMERGVKLFIGSDAHALDALGSVDLLQSVVEDLGVQEEDLWHPKEWVW